MNQLAFSHSGMYRRYSDDFILIIPISSNINNYTEIEVIIKNIAEECKINIKDEKTNTFLYSQHNLINLNNKSKQNMDYLGFNFDGKNVKMRNKSIYRFYRNAKKLINYANFKKTIINQKSYPIVSVFIGCIQIQEKVEAGVTALQTMPKKHKLNSIITHLIRII